MEDSFRETQKVWPASVEEAIRGHRKISRVAGGDSGTSSDDRKEGSEPAKSLTTEPASQALLGRKAMQKNSEPTEGGT